MGTRFAIEGILLSLCFVVHIPRPETSTAKLHGNTVLSECVFFGFDINPQYSITVSAEFKARTIFDTGDSGTFGTIVREWFITGKPIISEGPGP
jgi:hypothetical protein